MKAPYTLLSSEILLSAGQQLPEKTRHYLKAATEINHLIFERSELISQRLQYKSLLADLIQIQACDDLLMKLEIKKNRIFLFFALRGSVEFYNKTGFPISNLRQNSYYVSYKQEDDYFFRCPAGDHLAFIFSMSFRRFRKLARHYPLLLRNLSPKTSDFSVLPVVPIHKETYRSLQEIYSKPAEAVLPFIQLALATYHSQASPRLPSLPYQIKEYIRSHYTSPGLNYQSTALHFQVTVRKLQDDFKSEFGYTIQQYTRALRMQDAYQKNHIQQKPISEVYYEVGYDYESSFRKQYNKYLEFVASLKDPFKSPPY